MLSFPSWEILPFLSPLPFSIFVLYSLVPASLSVAVFYGLPRVSYDSTP
jgi:hypothetical protein